MKSKLLFLSFLMLLMVTTNYAQSSASVSGIAVQGIARDDNNTALINASVRFTFTIYNRSTSDEVHFEDPTITTDEFGVFSHTIAIPIEKYANFGSEVLWLKIEDENGKISDEIFKHVPYAISANNGVPTGSIMPFIGADAPVGWALCDGGVLSGIETQALRDLLGVSNVPDLRGMFLRGTGTSPVNGENGPALMTTQGDDIKQHNHGAGDPNNGGLKTDIEPNHNHDNGVYNQILYKDLVNGLGTAGTTDRDVGQPDIRSSGSLKPAGAHGHDVTGTTANSGGNESRPVNFGVNYIIKL